MFAHSPKKEEKNINGKKSNKDIQKTNDMNGNTRYIPKVFDFKKELFERV